MWNTMKTWFWRDAERTLEAGVALSMVAPGIGLGAIVLAGSGIALAEQLRGKNLFPALTELHAR